MLINPETDPPVAKVASYSKMKYEASKASAGSKQKKQEVKEIKLRPVIGQADYDRQVKHTQDFLSNGAVVNVTLILKGRELNQIPDHVDFMEKFLDAVGSVANIENKPTVLGKRISVTLKPKKSPK